MDVAWFSLEMFNRCSTGSVICPHLTPHPRPPHWFRWIRACNFPFLARLWLCIYFASNSIESRSEYNDILWCCIWGSFAYPWMFLWCCFDLLSTFTRCSLDARWMFDRCSIDARYMFNGLLIAVRFIFVTYSIDVRLVLELLRTVLPFTWPSHGWHFFF